MVHCLVVGAAASSAADLAGDAGARRTARIAEGLRAAGLGVGVQAAGSAGFDAALETADVVLVALEGATPELVEHVHRADPLVPVVVHVERRPNASVAARLGSLRAHDCVVLDASGDATELAVRLRDAASRTVARRRERDVAAELLGTSQQLAQVRRYIERAAATGANVLITGESGTGKELVARAIHRHGVRAQAPFIAVNCSAIPDSLLESELFGHEKGAFTGAVARARGRFEQADGGTLLFDEIGEMPPSLQAKLLRVLQPPPGAAETVREITPVGSEAPLRVDVRLLFATHRDLRLEVTEKRFREDLFQRIHVLTLHVPPLRDRPEDVPLLARYFLERHARLEGRGALKFDPLVLAFLGTCEFPLNVRELEGVVRSLVIMKETGDTVVLGDLPPRLFSERGTERAGAATEAGRGNDAPPVLRTLAEVEDEHVRRVLEHAGGNKSQAARILGISRPALDRKLDRQTGHPA